jgi:hypothetical protein
LFALGRTFQTQYHNEGDFHFNASASANNDGHAGNDIPSFCPRVIVCSNGWAELVLLFIARTTAYCMFPSLFFVFFTKFKSTVTLLSNTSLSLWLPLSDLHSSHSELGKGIAWLAIVHTLAHLARWGMRHETGLISSSQCGLAGVFAFISVLISVLPMAMKSLKNAISYEQRRRLHVFGTVVFAISLTYHSTLLWYFMWPVLVGYTLEWMHSECKRTHKVPHGHFTKLDSGTQLVFQNPPTWDATAEVGYLLLCVPWISKSQWHPFSFYPDVNDPHAKSCAFIKASGDWTAELHAGADGDSTRSLWIKGPFSSPFAAAVDYSNLMIVATGVGITAAISCIQKYKDERVINLVWMCRDASLIKYYVPVFAASSAKGFTLIYYTGGEELEFGRTPHTAKRVLKVDGAKQPWQRNKRRASLLVLDSIRVLQGRPNLCNVVTTIVQSVQEKVHLPLSFGPGNIGFVQEMSPDEKQRWCVMYCGGSKPVIKALQITSKLVGIDLKEESFEW